MFSNYLKIAWRSLVRYRVTSLINLVGLTIGLTCCLLITIYLLNELSYDRYHQNADQIYRVTRTFKSSEGAVTLRLASVAPAFGYYFPTDFPEITRQTRMMDAGILPLKYQEKIFNEKNVYFADENLFSVFTVDVLKGNPATALKDPFSVMLTEEAAQRYFGSEDPMDKSIRYNNQLDLKVTGIFRAFPGHSHIHPGMLISFNTLNIPAIYGEENLRTSWGNNSFFTYFLLPDAASARRIEAGFPAFIDKRMSGKEYIGRQPSKFTSLALQKLTDIHLYSHTDYEAEPNGDISRIYIFAAIAFFILLIACINYMNLSTARSTLRAKEIGIRKVSGARRKELIFQFLGESVLICLVASLLATGLAYLSLPALNALTGQEQSATVLLRWEVLLPLFLTPFMVGVVSGLYPALFLSSFQPARTLKGIFRVGGQSISFRKALVITQFAIGIILIIATVVVFQQLRFVQRSSLGFDKDQVIFMGYDASSDAVFPAFRDELLRNSSFREVTRSSRIPSGRLLDAMNANIYSGDSLKPVKTDMKFLVTDEHFSSAYGLSLAAGRYFSRDYGMDTTNYVINEAAARALDWTPDKAIGRDFAYAGRKGKIVGVVRDFHFESMHQPIIPLVFCYLPPSMNFYHVLSVKISGRDLAAALNLFETTWKKFYPGTAVDYGFIDHQFDQLYNAEQRQGKIFTLFACIALFIACLGLLGLSAFAISQRIKEIGIRKALGASVQHIVLILSLEFLALVGLAALVAFPLAWFGISRWLQAFAYRIDIHWWVFALAGIGAASIAFLTVGGQALKAAIANPVKSLRNE